MWLQNQYMILLVKDLVWIEAKFDMFSALETSIMFQFQQNPYVFYTFERSGINWGKTFL